MSRPDVSGIIRRRAHRALSLLMLAPCGICAAVAALLWLDGAPAWDVTGCLLAAAVALAGGVAGCGWLDRALGVRP